jgi:Holliday junction resolvase-like predicted endonuclease
MQNDGLLYFHEGVVEADSFQRLKLAVHAVTQGADIQSMSTFLRWQEFESIAAMAFEKNGHNVLRNFRFKHAGRRWEMDIVGLKKPIAVCMDCKHWHHGMYPSALKRIVQEQMQRTLALVQALPNLVDKIQCATWDNAKFVPSVLSLVAGRFKFYEDVPIVPVLQLQDFLNQLPAHADSLKHFMKS